MPWLVWNHIAKISSLLFNCMNQISCLIWVCCQYRKVLLFVTNKTLFSRAKKTSEHYSLSFVLFLVLHIKTNHACLAVFGVTSTNLINLYLLRYSDIFSLKSHLKRLFLLSQLQRVAVLTRNLSLHLMFNFSTVDLGFYKPLQK